MALNEKGTHVCCGTFMLRTQASYKCMLCGSAEKGEIPTQKDESMTIEHHTSKHYQDVKKFMQGARQECPDLPCIPSEEVRLLRAKLILEEALETIDALGFEMHPDIGDGNELRDYELVPHIHGPNLEQIVDGCCDIKVVTTGTLIACGVADLYPQGLVDSNNLEKIEKGTIREDGKLIKPPDHQPPDIAGCLALLGYVNEKPAFSPATDTELCE